MLDRFVRWVGVIRAQRPALLWSYPAFFLFAFPLAGVAVAIGGPFGNAAGALFLGGRLAIALGAVTGQWRAPLRALLEAMGGDAVLTVAFARALSTRTISWRGASLRLTSGALESGER